MQAPKELLDSASLPFGKPELDLFSVPPTQVGVEDSFFTEVLPQATVTTDGPWEFRLAGSQFMTDLSRNYLFVRLQIKQEDGTNLPAIPPPADGAAVVPHCAPVNLLGKTLFQQLKLYLNGKMAYDTGDTYSYISYLTTMLQYGKETKEAQLQAAGYLKDDPDNIDGDRLQNNPSYKVRGMQYTESHLVELMAPLDFPLAQQERYLPSNVEVKVSLQRQKDDFVLLSHEQGANYKLRINDIRWMVRQVKVAPPLEMTLYSAMQKQLAKYPVRRVQVRTLYIAPATTRTPTNSLWSGQIPRRMIIGMVSENAYNGQYALSPFNFQHFNLRKAWVVANGETYPKRGRPIEARFDVEHQYMQMFIQFYEGIGLGAKDKSVGLGVEDLKKGHCLLAIDLKADSGNEDNSWEVVQSGNLSVHVELGTPVGAHTGGVRVICMAEFDNLMTIDGNMNVYSDFAI